MDSLPKEQLHTLVHDLNSSWTSIHGAIYMLNETGLSPTDCSLYEDMLSRNALSVQASLMQLIGHLSLDSLLSTISDLLSELGLQKSPSIMAQLDPLFVELNQRLRLALV